MNLHQLRFLTNSVLGLLFPLFTFSQLPVNWNKLTGGNLTFDGNFDEGRSIAKTQDGGYVIAGVTNSADGDLLGVQTFGENDVLVVKINSSGIIEWKKVFGGSANDICNSIIVTSDGGYFFTGATYSSDGNLITNKGRSDLWAVKLTSTGDLQWQKAIGGLFEDEGIGAVLSGDGGYVITGYTFSKNGDISTNKGISDLLALKLDANGNIVWLKNFGGSNLDQGNSISNSPDGGFVIAGYTYSTGGDVAGKKGAQDAWVIKINAAGTLVWQKAVGGSSNEYALGVTVATDGAVYFAGGTSSTDGDVFGNKGGLDLWVVKLESTGVLLWQKCFGGTQSEAASGITLQADGSIFAAGYSNSTNGDVIGNLGQTDIWAIKISNAGILQWQNCLGGTGNENASCILIESDNSHSILGRTNSKDGDVSGLKGGSDIWLVKLSDGNTLLSAKTYGGTSCKAFNSFNRILSTPDKGSLATGVTNSYSFTDHQGKEDFFVTKFDSTGVIKWQKCFGGTETDIATSAVVTKDSGFLIVGHTISDDGNISSSIGSYDGWVVKLDSTGAFEWDINLGGTDDDYIHSVTITYDGGYVLAGYSASVDGDAVGNHGLNDFWIVKINSTGGVLWKHCYGGTDSDEAYDVVEGKDSSLIITGNTLSEDGNITLNNGSYDIWTIKLSKTGSLLWQKTFGGSNNDLSKAIINTADSGYVITGSSGSADIDFYSNKGGKDLCVLKISNNGSLQWQKTYGGANDDEGNDVVVNQDREYMLTGYTKSSANDVTEFKGVQDIWMLNLREDGSLKWQKTLGGTQAEIGNALSFTSKNNYLLAGNSISSDGDLLGINNSLVAKEKALTLELGNCPVTNVYKGGPLEFCSGGNVVLSTDSLGGYSYQWLKDGSVSGTITNTNTISQTGAYSVRVTNTLGCSVTSPTVSVKIKPTPAKPALTPDGLTNRCIGDGLVINTSTDPAVYYEWRRNGNSILGLSNQDFYYASNAGTYTLILQDKTSSCRSVESLPVVVNFYAQPGQPVITNDGNTLVSSSSTGNQWYLNDVLVAGATGQRYTPSSAGDYTVVVTTNSCSSVPSDPVNFVITAAGNINNEFNLKVYPVPIEKGNELTVAWNSQLTGNQVFTAILIDINGRVMMERNFSKSPFAFVLNQPPGLYFLRIFSSEKRLLLVSKIIVQ